MADKLITLEGLEQYHDTLTENILNNKIDKIKNTRNSIQIYAAESKENKSKVTLVNMSIGVDSNSIAKRTDGGQLRASDPKIAEDLTTKGYVDEKIKLIFLDGSRDDEDDWIGDIPPASDEYFYNGNTTIYLVCFMGNNDEIYPLQWGNAPFFDAIHSNLRLIYVGENPDGKGKWKSMPLIDQSYNATGENAQSGKAVAEAIANKADSEKLNSLYYYGDINIKPSDSSLFDFTINEDGETASVKFNGEKNELGEFTYEGNLVIPYEYIKDGKIYKVTNIGTEAFKNCYGITSIDIPICIVSIGYKAFLCCDHLASITIPKGVESLNSDSFVGCIQLNNITIPNSVINIDYNTFFQCNNLTDVYFKGTKEQWESITIENDGNEPLFNATIHYDWCDGSSGSGTEPFYVNFSVAQTDDAGNISKLQSDKTALEIREAVEEGKNIIAGCIIPDSNNTYLSPKLESYDNSLVTFASDIGSIKYTAFSEISDDTGLWEVHSVTNITMHNTDDFIYAYGHRISNLLDPINVDDAATKSYVDGIFNNIPKEIIDLGVIITTEDAAASGYTLNLSTYFESFITPEHMNKIYKFTTYVDELGGSLYGPTTGYLFVSKTDTSEDDSGCMQTILNFNWKPMMYRCLNIVWNDDGSESEYKWFPENGFYESISTNEVQHKFNAKSSLPISGKGVAEAIANKADSDSIILTSPNGTKYKLSVSDSGELITILIN